jgi:hypothetical protein
MPSPVSSFPAGPASIYGYDLTYAYQTLSAAAGYEEIIAVTAIQGLVNRDAPTLFVWIEPSDTTWFNILSSSTPSQGGWLAGTTVTNITGGVEALVAQFRSTLAGAAVFDPSVPCTSAIAETAAGADSLLPIAYRPSDPTSLYSRLISSPSGPRLPVALDLVGRFNGSVTGSVKRDAYEWAVANYIATNKTDASSMAFYVDYWWTTRNDTPSGWEKATIPNHDFGVRQRAFFFDLSIWGDEAPVDEPDQPLGSDKAAFLAILAAAVAQVGTSTIITIRGFTPWAYKYVAPNGKHQGVETEWETAFYTSAFNTMVDADACCIGNMGSASFYAHYPLEDRYVQPPAPTPARLQSLGLLTPEGAIPPSIRLLYFFYAGDFDSAAWLYSQELQRWQDPARGSVPLAWAVDPGLAARFPPIWPLMLGNLAPRDNVITGDSGSGYLNPTMLYGVERDVISGLPDARPAWVSLNARLNRRFGITMTGFAITGDALPMDATAEAMYLNCSSDGLIDQDQASWLVPHLTQNMPVAQHWDIPGTLPDAVKSISSFLPSEPSSTPNFHMFRSVLTSPSYLQSVEEGVVNATNGTAVAVGPMEFSYLMRVAFGGTNDNRVGYVNDTLPATVPKGGGTVSFTATVENRGWNTLAASNHSLVVSVVSTQIVVDARSLSLPRHAWGGAGLVSLEAGGAAGSLRVRLARAGFAGLGEAVVGGGGGGGDAEEKGMRVEAAAAASSFPFPSDLPVGGRVTVPAQVTLPPAPSSGELLVQVQYQVAGADGTTFDAYGSLPWVADVLVLGQ